MTLRLSLALLCLSAPAAAQDAGGRADARAMMHETLEGQAVLPATPPRLPDTASEGARDALEDKAFRKMGELKRRGEATATAASAASAAANKGLETARAAQQAAEERADAASQAAAGRSRAEAAKKKPKPPRP